MRVPPDGSPETIGNPIAGLCELLQNPSHSVPTASYAANSAWQQLVALTHNLLVNFQLAIGAVVPLRSRKRTVLYTLRRIPTLWFVLFQ